MGLCDQSLIITAVFRPAETWGGKWTVDVSCWRASSSFEAKDTLLRQVARTVLPLSLGVCLTSGLLGVGGGKGRASGYA